MDFEGLRETLLASQQSTVEQVSVNQRHLIDKILARYSAEYTVYREVIQNANDAGALSMELDFRVLKDNKSNGMIKTLALKNDGRPFTTHDWTRLKSIAEGNPDEQKIGFFGVGFYSLFSICEEPMVVSGGRALSFYWQRDQLFTRMAPVQVDASDNKWTSVYLNMREAIECPDWDSFAQFVAKSLLFTRSLQSVTVRLDGGILFKIDKKCSPEQELPCSKVKTLPQGIFHLTKLAVTTCQISLDKRYSSPAESKGFFEDLWRMARESMSKDSEVYEAMRKPGLFNLFARIFVGDFAVSLSQKTSNELERIMKKKAAKQVRLMAIYSSYEEQMASDTVEKIRHPVLDGVIAKPTGKHTSHPTGRLFIGFETHQTCGVAVHCCGPFIPTVERESIDFVDPTIRAWNQECVGAGGLMLRAIWDYELNGLDFLSANYRPSADHIVRSFPFAKTHPSSAVGECLILNFLSAGEELQVPSSRGVTFAKNLRVVPDDMQSFLLDCPQLLTPGSDGFNQFLLSRVSGVKEAGVDDLIGELKTRKFSEKELIAAIKWCLRGNVADEQRGSILMNLIKVPSGSNGNVNSLRQIEYYVPEHLNLTWPVPESCASKQFSRLLAPSEWTQFNIRPLPIAVWLFDNVNQTKEVDYEQIFADLSYLHDNMLIAESDLSACCGMLSQKECVLTSYGTMALPKNVYFESVLQSSMQQAGTGNGLAVVDFKRKRTLISDDILKRVGVQNHVPTENILLLIRQGTVSIDRVWKYLVSVQNDLSHSEMEDLKNAQLFQGVDGKKHRLSDLYKASKAAELLKLNILKLDVDYDNHSQVRLLRRLGFNFYIPHRILLDGLKQDSRLYDYLFENIDVYKGHIDDHVLCVDGSFRRASECFLDVRCAMIGLPVVSERIQGLCQLHLSVAKRPCGDQILASLTDKVLGCALNDDYPSFVRFLADCEWSDADIYRLGQIAFVKVKNDHQGRMKKFACARDVYLKVPAHFEGIFMQADTHEDTRIKRWMQTIGVQEEPNANDLMLLSGKENLLEKLGLKRYVALLRLFSLHYDDISDMAKQQFAQSKVFVGVILDEEVAGLYDRSSVFIGDDAVSQRQFHIPVCPVDDLHSFYLKFNVKRVSDCIDTQWMSAGVETVTEKSEACRKLILSRARLIIIDGLKLSSELVDAFQGIAVKEVQSLALSKTFNRSATKTIQTTACYDPSTRKILIAPGNGSHHPDYFDLAGCLMAALERPKVLSDCLLVSTLLSMPVAALKERGFVSADHQREEDAEESIDLGLDLEKVKIQPNTPQDVRKGDSIPAPTTTSTKKPEINKKHPEQKPNVFEKIFSIFTGKAPSIDSGQSMGKTLQSGIRASRSNHGHTIRRDQSRPKPVLEDVVNSSKGSVYECTISNDLIFSNLKIGPFEYYATPGNLKEPPADHVHVLASILNPLSSVFSLPTDSMHLFNDPHSRSIAFNRGGSLFFNAHYVTRGHDNPSFWYMTICHELAHNFCSNHDERHEYYMMSYAEHYLDRYITSLQ